MYVPTRTRDLEDVSSTAPTNDQVLKFNSSLGLYVPGTVSGAGGAPSFSGASVYSTADKAASGTTTVAFDSTRWDTDSYFDNATDLFSAPSTGYYSFKALVNVNNASGDTYIKLRGSGYTGPGTVLFDRDSPGLAYPSLALAVDLHMDSGDTIGVSTSSDASYTILGAPESCWMQIHLIGT